MIFSGYRILEEVYKGDKIVVYRGLRELDRQPIVFKMLKAEYSDPVDIIQLSYEYALLKKLDFPGIIKAYSFEKQQNRYAIVLEDLPNSCTLRTFFKRKPSFTSFLQVAIQLAEALDKLHTANVIHKNINPDNILIFGENNQVKLIDLSIATQLLAEEQEAKVPELLEGSLPYISPEQTTRMNRSIDRRTDFYSLGITFYEMLVGHLPYQANDAIEWVYCHITKTPPSPRELNAEIPEMLSLIIMKLLAKSPEDRYMTAYGLKVDLEKCLTAWQQKQKISFFELGVNDRAAIFQIPQKLFGREQEIHDLLEAFDRVSQGTRELLLVAGNSGIGKSSLINEIQKPIVHQKGYFIAGKYEKYRRDIPYAGFIHAFDSLLNQILAEDEQRVATWRAQLLKAVGSDGQLIINVIPSVEKLIGKQPSIEEKTSPVELRKRFEAVFFNFVYTFAKKDHPLVIFLDDLQWADPSTFNLITKLLNDKNLHYFLLFGAYRHKELPPLHPLLGMKKQLTKEGFSYFTLQLQPLSKQSIVQLIQETLSSKNPDIEELSQLVMDKTGSNPYFVNVFLTILYKMHQISYEFNQWVWDLQAIRSMSITENVVDLIINEISQLPKATQKALKVASCIGNQFTLNMLALLLSKPSKDVAHLLWQALQDKWIVPLSDNYNLAGVDTEVDIDSLTVIYKFSHDRVQQALYSLMSEKNRKKIHFKIGKSLLDDYNEDNLFVIVQNFSICIDLLLAYAESDRIAELFYKAANIAKNSISYGAAVTYFNNAIKLFDPWIWQQRYDFALNLHIDFAYCLFLSGAFADAEAQFKAITTRAKTNLDEVKIDLARILMYTAQSRIEEVNALCEEGLRKLNIIIPGKISKFTIVKELLKVSWWLRGKTPDDILDLPIMRDPEKTIAMEFLKHFLHASFLLDPNNFKKITYLIVRIIDYSIHYGNDMNSAIGYVYYAQILLARGKIAKADQFAKIAISLSERFNNAFSTCIVYLLSLRIFVWTISYKKCLDYGYQSLSLSRESGNVTYYQMGALALLSMMLNANMPLPDIQERVSNFLVDPYCTCNDAIKWSLMVYQHSLDVLSGKMSVSNYQTAAKEILLHVTSHVHLTVLLGLQVLQFFLAYVVQDLPLATQTMKEIMPQFKKREIKSLFIASSYLMMSGLLLLTLYPKANFRTRLRYRLQLKKIVSAYKKWAKQCPDNYEPQYLSLKAGIAELNGDIDQALIYYEQAITIFRNTERLFAEACCHEYMARCYIKRNQFRNAKSYLQDACAAYHQWGAVGKVEMLRQEFPFLLAEQSQITGGVFGKSKTTTSQILDLDSVLKSTQIISSHVELRDLLKTLIAIVLENAGAQRGLVLLKEYDQLVVAAEGEINHQPRILQKEPFFCRHDLCFAIVNYVQNTQKTVVLGDAAAKGSYTEDSYIKEKKPLSILCVPILYQNYLLGVLYLENNLVRDAFTMKRCELLQVLSTQIAISLENSRLYSAYDQFIPHEFLEILGKRSIMDVRLGDHVQKEMSVLFTDIRRFLKLAERLGPAKVFEFLNIYLSYMEPIIRRYGGFIDKYIGDAIMALFAGKADGAVRAGVEMQKKLSNYNQELIDLGETPIDMGIGINSGTLILGTLGSQGRLETSVISDAVNVAERLQELTKEYNCQLIIGDNTYKQLVNPKQFDMRFIGKTAIRGKEQEIDIWEVYSSNPDHVREAKLSIENSYNEATTLYFQKAYHQALLIFEYCLTKLPNDKVIQNYIAHCQTFLDAPL
jgi:predicted ATPase/class 3 adenylate cyclase